MSLKAVLHDIIELAFGKDGLKDWDYSLVSSGSNFCSVLCHGKTIVLCHDVLEIYNHDEDYSPMNHRVIDTIILADPELITKLKAAYGHKH